MPALARGDLAGNPLAEPSRPADGRLFEEVEAGRSGVSFLNEYNHPKRWTDLWHQYFLGTIGTGVALGDVNGDGLPDLFAVGKDSPNALYLNEGDFRFRDATEEAGLSGGSGIGAGCAMVDVNNDGHLDLYVTYVGSPNELYINDGSGRFTEVAAEWGLDVNTGSNAPSFADYDRDGDLDLYLQCNFLTSAGLAEGMPDRLFENRDGHFVEVTEAAGISGNAQGHAAVWWDYDEDGWPDLYVANDFAPADKLYRNNKDGTFTDVIGEALPAVPYSAMGADIGDLNNDGHMDLLVGEMATRDPGKHQRTVATIETKTMYAPRYTVGQFMHNTVSLKIGPEQFAELGRLTGMDATDWTWAVRSADLDCDGRQDVLFTNGMIRAFHDGDLGVRSEKARTGWQRMAFYKSAPRYDERNQVYRNEGGLAFTDVSAAWGFDPLGVSFAAAFADFDGDGDLDIVVSNLDGNLTLYRNNAPTGNRIVLDLRGVESNRYGVGAKLRLYHGDQVLGRELTSTRGYLSTDEPIVHFGLGDVDEVDRIEIDWPSGIHQVIRRPEVNRRYEVTEQATPREPRPAPERLFEPSPIDVPTEASSREEVFRLYPKQTLLPEDETALGPPMAWADLDGDGWVDLILGGPGGQETRVFRNAEGRALVPMPSEAFEDHWESEDRSIALRDLTGDGRLDLFVTSGGVELDEDDPYYRDRVYLNRGAWEFEALDASQASFPRSASSASVWIDCDGDGELELLVAGGTLAERYPDYEDNTVWKWTGAGFERDVSSPFARAFARSGNTTALEAVDWTGDGVADLVQLAQWGAPIFWRQFAEGLRESEALSARSMRGKWRSLAVADFDGDGRLDIVLGNEGANLRRQPSPSAPLALFSPRDAASRNVYIEAFTDDRGRLRPVESRLLHEAQFPGLMDRTSSSIAEYSEMSLEEIFTPEVLEALAYQEVDELRSVLLLQREPGRFTKVPLPLWAQSGVAMDLLAEDVDGDGWPDLVMALEPRPSKLWSDRRLPGHLLVLRNRQGEGFEPILPWRSGLGIQGRPRSLVWQDLDQDGRPELAVALSDGPVLLFTRAAAGAADRSEGEE